MERNKFIQHEATGLPIRIPPYLGRELVRGDETAMLQLNLIARSKVIGDRTSSDTLAANFEENVRLRRAARCVSQRLVEIAVGFGAPRYFTFVHGSVARGLVRSPGSNDPSDVDVDLVVDGVEISCADRQAVRSKMQALCADFGVKPDVYVYDIDDLKRDNACCARRMLEACSYPLANVGGLFEEARLYGLEALRFFELNKRARTRVKSFVAFSEQCDHEGAIKVLDKDKDGVAAAAYIGHHDGGSLEGLSSRVAFLNSFMDLSVGKAKGAFYGS